MTDQEINKLVAERLGYTYKQFKIFRPDYCNNPSHAWPIILENGISLLNIKGTTAWFSGNDFESYTLCTSPDGSDTGASCYDIQNCKHSTNPLRAAMIVFLMMGNNDD